jgi:hypothetical protein
MKFWCRHNFDTQPYTPKLYLEDPDRTQVDHVFLRHTKLIQPTLSSSDFAVKTPAEFFKLLASGWAKRRDNRFARNGRERDNAFWQLNVNMQTTIGTDEQGHPTKVIRFIYDKFGGIISVYPLNISK